MPPPLPPPGLWGSPTAGLLAFPNVIPDQVRGSGPDPFRGEFGGSRARGDPLRAFLAGAGREGRSVGGRGCWAARDRQEMLQGRVQLLQWLARCLEERCGRGGKGESEIWSICLMTTVSSFCLDCIKYSKRRRGVV